MAERGTLDAACAHFAQQLGIEWPKHVELCFELFTPEQYATLLLQVALVSVLTEIRNAIQRLDPCPERTDNLDLENPPL